MRDATRGKIWRDTIRPLFAVAFLVFLLAEWGSHSVALSHSDSSGEGNSAYSTQTEHEDPCQTLIRCTDGSQQDRGIPAFGHELGQHNGFFPPSWYRREMSRLHMEPRIPRSPVNIRSRSISPPLQPPKSA